MDVVIIIIIIITSGLCTAVQLVSWVKPRASQMVAASSPVQAAGQYVYQVPYVRTCRHVSALCGHVSQ